MLTLLIYRREAFAIRGIVSACLNVSFVVCAARGDVSTHGSSVLGNARLNRRRSQAEVSGIQRCRNYMCVVGRRGGRMYVVDGEVVLSYVRGPPFLVMRAYFGIMVKYLGITTPARKIGRCVHP